MQNRIAAVVMGEVQAAFRANLMLAGPKQLEIIQGAISMTMTIMGSELSNTLKIVHNVLTEIAFDIDVLSNPDEVKVRLIDVMAFFFNGEVGESMKAHFERMSARGQQQETGSGEVQDPPNESGGAPEEGAAPAP